MHFSTHMQNIDDNEDDAVAATISPRDTIAFPLADGEIERGRHQPPTPMVKE